MWTNDLADTIALDGNWQFSLSVDAAWETIQAPGCWEGQGYSTYPPGPGRYRRLVPIPPGWSGKRIQLEFEAVSYACKAWCNGQEVGQHLGMWTPFALDLTQAARPGQDNLLELEVEKPGGRYPLRSSLSGFLPDVAAAFGGIWQPARLRALTCALINPNAQADYDIHAVRVRAGIETFGADLPDLSWRVEIWRGQRREAAQEMPALPENELDTLLHLPEAPDWSPGLPALFTVRLALLSADRPVAAWSGRTGFRRLSSAGDQLLFNNQPCMLRGVLSWGWEPEQVAPAYSPEQARAELRRVREMGFNLVKLCLFVPNQAYFDAADEEGVFLWAELPMWLPEVDDHLRVQAPVEYAELAARLAQHPSVVLYSLGCELNRSVDGPLLAQLDEVVRSRVHDALICDNSGSGESYGGLDVDLADFTDYHPYCDLHYFEPLLDNWRRDWQPPRPWIFGEFCDSDTFRDLDEIIRANGGSRPWWLTRENPVTAWREEAQALLDWENRLESAQVGFSVADIVRVSYRQSYVIRKYVLEAVRRRRGMGGYVITGLRDTPISSSGVWDDLERPKWSAQEWASINAEAVLALEVGRRRRWQHGGDRPDRVDPHNFWAGAAGRWQVILHDSGPGFPGGGTFTWHLSDLAGSDLVSGAQALDCPVAPGQPVSVGTVAVPLPELENPRELRLSVEFAAGDRRVENHWPVWVYPRPAPLPANLLVSDPLGLLCDFGEPLLSAAQIAVGQLLPEDALLMTTALDAATWEWIGQGGRALLLQQGDGPLPARRCPFWREAIKLFAGHPLWEAFPQRGFSDLQFFGLAGDMAFHTPGLPAALPAGARLLPILRRLDARAFHMSEYLLEVQFGRGRLLACALRLQGGAGSQPTGLQRNVAGGALLDALLRCLAVKP